MARSSRRRGENMPGVSTKISCDPFTRAMPRTRARVVCTFGVTIETFAPTNALMSVDFPTLGAPISAAKPQRACCSTCACSAMAARRLDALAREHGGCGSLFGGAFGASQSFRRREGRKLHCHTEFGTVIRPGPADFAIGWRRQAARLRPFLQHGLGIAQRLGGCAQADLP